MSDELVSKYSATTPAILALIFWAALNAAIPFKSEPAEAAVGVIMTYYLISNGRKHGKVDSLT